MAHSSAEPDRRPDPPQCHDGGRDAGRYARAERAAALAGTDLSLVRRRRVVVVGCGALGSSVAMHLVRSGVGHVRLVDRDIVERRNLVDQVLFSEADADRGRLKAEAAARLLASLNSACEVEASVADYGPDNALRLVRDADLIIDGADNVETKLLLNDVAVSTGTPLAYGGCAGSEGAVMVVRPGSSHCLRCLWPEPGGFASALSCGRRGVLPGAVAATAAIQFTEAVKVLTGRPQDLLGGLVLVDTWTGVLRRVRMPEFGSSTRPCPACRGGDFAYLDGRRATRVQELCGDGTVLLSRPAGQPDLARLTECRRRDPTLRSHAECVHFDVDGCRVVVFSTGRTLVHGARDTAHARSIYAQHVAV